METINNIATAAVKVVWGDNEANKEPISGAQGDVSKGQPYDAGNLAPEEQEKVKEEDQKAQRPTEPEAPSTTATTGATDSISSTTDTKLATPGANDVPPTNVGAPDSVSKPSVTDASAAKPSVDASTGQHDPRDPEDADGEVELKGPGPRPLEVVAKEHGGDAGRDHDVSSKTSGSSSAASETKNSADASSSDKSENLGDGTQYIKTTGLAADGGDFDATKPGAGKEADRIMDEKGLHHNEDKSEGKSSSHRGHTKDKPSLGERIKAKLHKH